jgi:hypothetical protein
MLEKTTLDLFTRKFLDSSSLGLEEPVRLIELVAVMLSGDRIHPIEFEEVCGSELRLC